MDTNVGAFTVRYAHTLQKHIASRILDFLFVYLFWAILFARALAEPIN